MSLNNLTGDSDVVVEFTLTAANRVLAAVHSGNRFPHSLSLGVDDTARSKRSARAAVDFFGEAVSDPKAAAGALASGVGSRAVIAGPSYQKVNPIANATSGPFGGAQHNDDFRVARKK